ncbi:MAG: Cof-type HAD-IIB family hydrolase [Bacteroidaceae bacterium]
MVKAIFFDIDGTLVSFKTHRIPESTIQAMSLARAKGIKLYIATGRAKGVINNLQGLTFDGYITMNGSVCFNGADEVIYNKPFDVEDQIMMAKLFLEEPSLSSFVFTKDKAYVVNKNEALTTFVKLLNFPQVAKMEPSEMLDQDIYQYSAFLNADEEAKFVHHLKDVCITRWHPAFIDISKAGNSKAVGIDQILAHDGFDLADCIAFGDGGNDIDMIKHVPRGVAMGNAADEVKASANYVTTTVDDDGIANALRHYGVIE